MTITKRKNAKGDKIYFTIELGRGEGQRVATGVFVYARPKDEVQKKHNAEALKLIEIKKSELILEQQSTGSDFIPAHKFRANFLDYYQEYVNTNRRKGNRHLDNSLTQFKLFLKKEFLAPGNINENLCKQFRKFLLSKFTGETPGNYYARFRQVLTAATADKYFRTNPSDKVYARTNPSKRLKENLEVEDYLKLLRTPCFNQVVQQAGIFSCYTGLRWVDVKALDWKDIKGDQLTTRIIQAKTGLPVTLTLHPIARAILEKRRALQRDPVSGRVFTLPSQDGSNIVLEQWVRAARIDKYITWSCLRLSFSILLQDKLVDTATVAYLMGHTTSEQVNKTYRRHRPLDQASTIRNLPEPEELPYFLKVS